MQPAGEPTGEPARMRGESDEWEWKCDLRELMTGHVGITSARLVNWGSTQVNSTGVPWAMYWGLNTIQKCAQTKLCYE